MFSFGLVPGQLNYVGKVRCSLYDTIPFTAAERLVIDQPEVQRLRRLKQTAFSHYVFPGATHTRFEHSLGVMHMAGIFFTALLRNQERLLCQLEGVAGPGSSGTGIGSDEGLRSTLPVLKCLGGSRFYAQVLRFAGLLHDLGHAPFSHSGERFMPTWRSVARALPDLDIPPWLRDAFEKKIARAEQKGPDGLDRTVRHEFYSVLFIERLFRRLSADSNALGTIHKEDLEKDLCAEMGRAVCALLDPDVSIGPECPLASPDAQGVRSLFGEIISGEIDVDRMDYLRRDAAHCGVVYGLFDAGRILDAAVFYQTGTRRAGDAHVGAEGVLHLALHRSGLAAYEDYLRARMSMYQQVYFHKTGTACEAMLASIRKQLGDFTLPLDPFRYLEFDDHSFFYLLDRECLLSPAVRNTLVDLLINRRLWKRIYEERTPRSEIAYTPTLTSAVSQFLTSRCLNSEVIESETNLSRFSPKGRSGLGTALSENSLKVLSRDFSGTWCLDPIEEHSRLINNLDEEFVNRRVFIPYCERPRAAEIQRDLGVHLLGQGAIQPTGHSSSEVPRS
jgi:HD superfamily phosphohydrolase